MLECEIRGKHINKACLKEILNVFKTAVSVQGPGAMCVHEPFTVAQFAIAYGSRGHEYP